MSTIQFSQCIVTTIEESNFFRFPQKNYGISEIKLYCIGNYLFRKFLHFVDGKMKECPYCNGTGRSVFGACPHCYGRGVIREPIGRKPICRNCKGTGRTVFGRCPTCGGSGKID